jgi:hypothetical protein
MENKIINLLEYRDMSRKSNDGMWTQGRLVDRIPALVHRVNTSRDSDADISEFIKNSFSINGILSTYNQLGYYGWQQMILQMAEHEVWERNKCLMN